MPTPNSSTWPTTADNFAVDAGTYNDGTPNATTHPNLHRSTYDALNKLQATNATVVNVKGPPYLAVGDGATDDTAAITAAKAAVGAGSVYFPTGTYKIISNIALTNVQFAAGALLSPAAGVTITITGAIQAPLAQIFTGAGKIILGQATSSTGEISPEVHTVWWGYQTVTVPGPPVAPDLTLGVYSVGAYTWVTGSTYDFAYTYEGWTGETLLSPIASITVQYNEGATVMPQALLQSNALAARIYYRKDGGAWTLGKLGGTGTRCGFAEDLVFGGVWVIPGGVGAVPGSNTALDRQSVAIADPTMAPIVTKIAALPPSTTFYGAYSYVCQDGTETALSPISVSATTQAARPTGYPCWLYFGVPQSPPSGAVFTNFYAGTGNTPADMHLVLANQPLHHANQDAHSYNAAGAAHVTGTAQSTISPLQQALDAVDTTSARSVILPPGQHATQVPLIFRAAPVGLRLFGMGGHADPGSGVSGSRVMYNGTLTGVEMVVFNAVNWQVESIDFYDWYLRCRYGVAFCDFTNGQAFNSTFTHCSFAGMMAGGGFGLRVDPTSTRYITSHTASEMYFQDCSFWGSSWPIHISGSQTCDFRFKDITTNVFGTPATANCGEVRLCSSSGCYFYGHNVNALGQYGYYVSTEGSHPAFSNFLSIDADTVLFEAKKTAVIFYVSGTIVVPVYVAVHNSTMISYVVDHPITAVYAGGPAHVTLQSNQQVDRDVLLVHPDATMVELGGLSGFNYDGSALFKSVSPSYTYPPVKIRNGPLHLNGSNFYMVTGVPSNAVGANGDFAFRSDGTVAGHTVVYHKEAAAWVATAA